MRHLFFLTAVVAGWVAAHPAAAQTPAAASGDSAAQPVAGVAAIALSRRDCRRLVEHQAQGDVAFKPGVDVHGKAVAPAEAEPGPDMMPKGDIIIRFGIDLAQKYGFDSGNVVSAEADIATVVYSVERGDFTLNGKPLQSEERRALRQACLLSAQSAN